MNTLVHLLAFKVTPTHKRSRAHVADVPKAVQEGTGRSVQVALVDRGHTCTNPAQAAAE